MPFICIYWHTNDKDMYNLISVLKLQVLTCMKVQIITSIGTSIVETKLIKKFFFVTKKNVERTRNFPWINERSFTLECSSTKTSTKGDVETMTCQVKLFTHY